MEILLAGKQTKDITIWIDHKNTSEFRPVFFESKRLIKKVSKEVFSESSMGWRKWEKYIKPKEKRLFSRAGLERGKGSV